jgi:hypothetical protein
LHDSAKSDHRALTHAPRHFVRIGIQATPRRRDLHAFEPVEGVAAGGAAPYVQMPDQRLGDLLANREDGIKRGGRLLEDHRDAVAAQFLEPALRGGGYVFPVEHDTAGNCTIMRQKAHQGA